MKYKVGDKVRVREDLAADNWYGNEIVVPGMTCLKGKIVTISNTVQNKYEIKEDSGCYWWTDEMFLPITKYNIGDKVFVREDLKVGKEYGKDFFVSEMNFLKGEIVTITNIVGYKYRLKEDSGKWSWTEEMFSGKVSKDSNPKESVSQNILPKEENSSDIIIVKTTKLKLYF